MKIAVVIDTWFPSVGGGQVNALEIAKIISKTGNKITIITRNNGLHRFEKVNGPTIVKIGSLSNHNDSISRIVFLWYAFLFIKKNNYEVVHLQAFLPGLLSPFIRQILKIPTVFTVHGTRLFEKRIIYSLSFLLEIIILCLVKYDAQISVTKEFLKFKNINKNKTYIPNGIDAVQFKKIKYKKPPVPTILWVGRFDPVKRVEDLLFAVKNISVSEKQIRLKLAGYGQEEESLRKLAKKLKLNNVYFLGKKSKAKLIKIYKSSSIFVLPSSSEGQPLVLLEAMTAGIPIIATKVGGVPELIKKTTNTVLVPPKRPDLISKSILKILNSKNYRVNNHNNINLENYNWRKVAYKTLNVYKGLIE